MKIKHTRKDLGLISEDPDTGSEHRGHHEERSPHSTCCGSSELWMLIQLFLSCVITLDERIWTFSFICRFHADLHKVKSVVITLDERIWTFYFVCRFHADLHKVKSVLRDPEHALCGESERLPQRRRFRSLAHKTNRRGNSCSLCSSPPQQGKISPLNQLFTIL